jgi:hypothetical protein
MFSVSGAITGATIAFLAGTAVAWWVGRLNNVDRKDYDRLDDDEPRSLRRALLLHIRQDLKLIAFQLFAILVALGFIAGALIR